MNKINTKDIPEESWASPKGKFGGASKGLSEALGRKPFSTDLKERHPFDVEITRISPRKTPYPYHSHSAQWEFYYSFRAKASFDTRMGRRRSRRATLLSSSRKSLIPSLPIRAETLLLSS